MKKTLLFLWMTSCLWAQNPDRKFMSHSWNNQVLKVQTTQGEYHIKPYSPDVMETTFIPKGEKVNTASHAVVAKPHNVKAKIKDSRNQLRLSTSGLTVIIIKNPFQIAYLYEGEPLLSEKAGYLKRKHQPLEYVSGNIIADSTEVLQFNLNPDEVLYGGGARALGMNRRGHKLPLFNRAHYGYETHSSLMNFCIPVVVSSQKYLLHFDNPSVGYLDLDSQKNNTLEYETTAGQKTYQVIAGKSWEKLMGNYVTLTGKQPLLPRWALGNFSSRFGYRTQDDTEGTIRKFEEYNVPVDAIILDLYWFGKTIKGTMGNLDWDRETFQEPEKMMADFNQKDIKTILITEPFILTTSSKWQEAADQNILATKTDGTPATWDFYFGNTGIVDVFKPEGRTWYWNIYKSLINQGVGGIWGDLGEPEVFPHWVQTTAGPAGQVHNIYGHQWAKLIAEGYQKDFPKQRPFILMRSGYSGSQRFGMIPWSGDVSRSWGGLKSQPEIALQMGLQGLAYMHSDLGGFAGDYYDNELYLRWLQYGVFQPIFRPHAQEAVASEVARKDIKTIEKARESVNLRYRLLPYNYTLAYENATMGLPLMRPLFFEEPENTSLWNHSESYLWGHDFLVQPITEAGQKETNVYFPKTSNWYDFHTGETFKAGSTTRVLTHENHIPVFVRAGAFIPEIPVVQQTAKYKNDQLTVTYYFDENHGENEREFYFDDGENPNALSENAYMILEMEAKWDGKTLKIEAEPNRKANYKGPEMQLELAFLHLPKRPSKIVHNGKNLTFDTDEKTGKVSFKTLLHSEEKTFIIHF